MKSKSICDFSTPVFKHLLTSYEQMVRANETVYFDSQQIYELATYFYYANKLDEALKVLDYGSSIYKKEETFILIKSKILIKLQQYCEAEALLNSLVQQETPRVFFERAMIAAVKGNKDTAEVCFEQILKQARNKRQVYINVAYFYLTHHFTEEAEKWWNLALKSPSFNRDFFYTRVVYEFAHKNYNQALRHSLSLIKKYPDELISWLFLARCEFHLRKYQEAYRTATYALNLHSCCYMALKIKEDSLYEMNKVHRYLTN